MDFEIGKVYTFNVYAPATLGTTVFKNVKLISILDYDTAKAIEPIDIKYRAVYPMLPAGTVDNPNSCMYYRFKSTDSKETVILADQWIDLSTIELIEAINFQVTITGGSMQDMTRVRNALNQLGFSNYEIKQI